MRKRLICILTALIFMMTFPTIPVLAETVQISAPGIPADAVSAAEERIGEIRLIHLTADTGEKMLLLLDAAGKPVYLSTENPAPVEDGTSQTTEEVLAAVRAAFPDAVIFRTASEGGLKAVSVATPNLLGTLWISGGRVIRRNLTGGSFLAEGHLTLDGACRIMQHTHPEAVLISMEWDGEDGQYEGEALVNGVRYELELNGHTGALLEWERD